MSDIKYRFSDLDEVKAFVNPNLPVMFDVETEKKKYGNEYYGKIRIAQFYQKGWDEVLIVEYPEPIGLVEILTNWHLVGHNFHYDITSIQENLGGINWKPKKFDDTMLLARLYFYKQLEFSFDKVVQYVLDYNPYLGEGMDQQDSNWSAPVLSKEQLVYAAKDVYYCQIVYDVVKDITDDYSYQLDILATKYALDMQWNGMPLDEDRLKARYADNVKRINEIDLPINCNSSKQVRAYLGSNLSDDLGLATLVQQGSEKAKAVRETRKLTKENSELEKYLESHKDWVIYGKFKCTTRSGRMASDDTNLQQINKKLKIIFGYPEDSGQVLIYADYPQIQLRGACVVTGDTTMEKLFREGADLHNYVAEMIFGKNFTPEQRQICKTANFGLLFGAGIKVFKSVLLKEAGLYLTDDEATSLKKKWLRLWVAIYNWQKSGIRAYNKGLIWETPLGRKYKANMMTDQLAMQIQGFEAEVAKLAWHYMLPKLDTTDVLARNFVHDSFIFSCPDDETIYKPAAKIIKDSMDEAWEQMCQSVKIIDLPMPNKVRVGYNWGDIEKGKFKYELA